MAEVAARKPAEQPKMEQKAEQPKTEQKAEQPKTEQKTETPKSRFAGLETSVAEVTRPTVGSGRASDESYKDLMPLVLRARVAGRASKALQIEWPTDKLKDLKRALRQAGDALEGDDWSTIRFGAEEKFGSNTRLAFWATEKITRPRT